ncbi:MAG: PAS domain S-box protein, partial [Nitrospiraceae bacterium]
MISSNNNTAAAFLEEFMKDNSALLDSIGYPVFIVDTSHNIVTSNKAMKMLWGDDLQNRKCYELLHQCDRPITNCILAKTLKSLNTEEMEIYEPGLKKHLKITSYPVMTAGGDPVGAVHSIMDITRLKEMEENDNELIEIYSSSINEMKSREMKAQRGRDAFLNMLEDISDSYKELEDLFLKLIRVMVNALDAKSPWTRGHSDRVSMYAGQIAE